MADPPGSSSAPTSPTTSVSQSTTSTPPPTSSTSSTPPPTTSTPPPLSTNTPPPSSTTGSSTSTASSSSGTSSGTSSNTGSPTATVTTPTNTPQTQSTSTVIIIATPSNTSNANTTPTVPTNQADSSGSGGGSSFFDNKAAVAGVFTIVGLAGLVLIIALLTNFIRRRRAAQFDRDVLAASAAPPTFYDDDMREPRAPQLYPGEDDMYDMQHYSSTPSPPRSGAYWNPNAAVPPSQQWNAVPVPAQNPFASPPDSPPPHPYAPYAPQHLTPPPQRAPSLHGGGNARGAYAAMALAAEERARQARSPPPGQYPAALLAALDPAPRPHSTTPSPQHGAPDGSTSTTDDALPNPFRSRTSHESEVDRKSIGDEDDYWQPGRGALKVANE